MLFVTRTQPADSAFAAISASITPIVRPDWSSVARIVAACEAAGSLNSTTGTSSTWQQYISSGRICQGSFLTLSSKTMRITRLLLLSPATSPDGNTFAILSPFHLPDLLLMTFFHSASCSER